MSVLLVPTLDLASPRINGGPSVDAVDGAALEERRNAFRNEVLQKFQEVEANHIGEVEKVTRLILPMLFETSM